MSEGKRATSAAPEAKYNAYAEAADPDRYRVADALLFTCAEHGKACVLCVTAGKNGRSGRTAAVGATLFWLTCPNLNAIIARFEGHRCVQAVSAAMAQQPCLCDWHVQSHDVYASRAKDLLSPAQWCFFESHFLSDEQPSLHKYGNAAVSHASDMKCLHALVAQTLAGVANPVGSVVVNYILLQHKLVCEAADTGNTEQQGVEEKRLLMKATLNSTRLFSDFTTAFVRAASERPREDWHALHNVSFEVPLPEGNMWCKTAVQYMWQVDSQLAALCPDLCARALTVHVALGGPSRRRHKKHRMN
ncbi:conserved hypothetical protein [Leishmania major strain Friedlin]|uniref:Uncharacterized protein n=1 Tax=Leishmania major TaxID=5664 RepID=Q4Q2H2_LEIMA|nr:conserved hypothetical protein [Leishmania major strain Friedlin]CAG9582250.1 Protein_of_unknown_function_(DUF501)_-_putative [Leishmania major strain Friedlin]CAJ08093.1 conserved hypothetical protein [Leishmania major strain Friedlin]|eukprot:XP_001686476.1 conserved hypothetical protein [Leishmania major strain Friedlin]